MTCHFIVGTYEYALVITAYYRFFNRTVEENYRYIFSLSLIDNVLSGIV